MSEDRTDPAAVDLGLRMPAIRLPQVELLMALSIRPFLQAICRCEAALRAGQGGPIELLLRDQPGAPVRRRAIIHVPTGFADRLIVDDVVRRDGS